VLTVTGLPVAHRAAVAPYRLEVYRGLPAIPAELASSETVSAADLTWTETSPVPAGIHYDVLVVDPIGRRSLPRRV